MGKNAFKKYVWSEYAFPHTSVKTAHLLWHSSCPPVGTPRVTALLLGQTRSSPISLRFSSTNVLLWFL